MISSANIKNSRYVQGGITEVGSIGLEVWNRFNFPKDISDRIYVIELNRQYRADLIAYDFYADDDLWWFICQYNNILDPYAEIEVGRVLYIPTLERLQLLLIQKPGGIPTTRQFEPLIPAIIL